MWQELETLEEALERAMLDQSDEPEDRPGRL
jgi:hypothetical protein